MEREKRGDAANTDICEGDLIFSLRRSAFLCASAFVLSSSPKIEDEDENEGARRIANHITMPPSTVKT
jgi:hypothetical protein